MESEYLFYSFFFIVHYNYIQGAYWKQNKKQQTL